MRYDGLLDRYDIIDMVTITTIILGIPALIIAGLMFLAKFLFF